MSNQLNLKNSKLKIITLYSFLGLIAFSGGYLTTKKSNLDSNHSSRHSDIVFKSKLGKSHSFVNVQIEPVNIPRSRNEVAEVKAYVTLLKNSNSEISYQWQLPEGANIVEGDITGVLQNAQVEVPIEVSLKLTGFSRTQKELLTLSASTKIDSISFGNVGVLSSRPEDSLEYLAQQKYESESLNRLDLSSEAHPGEGPIAINNSQKSQRKDLRSQERIQR